MQLETDADPVTVATSNSHRSKEKLQIQKTQLLGMVTRTAVTRNSRSERNSDSYEEVNTTEDSHRKSSYKIQPQKQRKLQKTATGTAVSKNSHIKSIFKEQLQLQRTAAGTAV